MSADVRGMGCLRDWSRVVALLFMSSACSAFDDEPCTGFDDEQGSPVVIRVQNQSEVSLHLLVSGFDSEEPFTLERDGEPVAWKEDPCGSCESAVLGNGCPLLPATPTAVQLFPGGHLDFQWPGTLRSSKRIARGCAPNGTEQCQQLTQGPSGEYTVSVTAFTRSSCEADSFCDCTEPFEQEMCVFQNALPTDPYATQRVRFDHPSAEVVEVTFE